MKRRAWIAASLLATSSLACSMFLGGPAYPSPQAPASPDVTGGVTSQIEQALAESLQTGVVKLTFDEAQLTAYIAAQLSAEATPALSDPQVLLRDGAMTLYGRAKSGPFEANVRIVTTFSVDATGLPQIDVTQADFGPLPAPQSLRDGISTFLRETLTGSLGPVATGFRLESIEIADGHMTVTGRVR